MNRCRVCGASLEGSAPAGAHLLGASRRREASRAEGRAGWQEPYLTLAETVSVRLQDRKEFESLLKRALEIDPDARPEWRLANLVGQRRARWLLARADLLFAD